MFSNKIQIEYRDCNGVDIKMFRHPLNDDSWNEIDACEEILNSEQEASDINMLNHEISWLEKYKNDNILVEDIFIGMPVTIVDYITWLMNFR